MANEMQRRYLPRAAQKITLQERADGALPIIVGYASVFYREGDASTEYEMWPADSYGGRVVERIMPGAFDRAIKEDDVRALFNHDCDNVLGRTGSGTCKLSVDAVGLRYEIDPPDTSLARDLIASLRRGDISGSSFAFVPRDTVYTDTVADRKVVETVVARRDVQLFDVGPVTYPAYAGASSGVRAAASDLDAVRADLDRRRAADLDSVAVAVMLAELEEAE